VLPQPRKNDVNGAAYAAMGPCCNPAREYSQARHTLRSFGRRITAASSTASDISSSLPLLCDSRDGEMIKIIPRQSKLPNRPSIREAVDPAGFPDSIRLAWEAHQSRRIKRKSLPHAITCGINTFGSSAQALDDQVCCCYTRNVIRRGQRPNRWRWNPGNSTMC
jgi:hypothetical protein